MKARGQRHFGVLMPRPSTQCGACKNSKSKRKCDGSHAGCEKYKGIQPEAATDTISDAQQRAEVDYTSEKVDPFFDGAVLESTRRAKSRARVKRKAAKEKNGNASMLMNLCDER